MVIEDIGSLQSNLKGKFWWKFVVRDDINS